MSNFEKIAASPEVLGAFLDSLNVATGPWDESFHNAFCDSCGRETCDAGHCPHEKERNNPTWWLTLTAEGEQDASCAVWRNDRVELEPGMIVPLREEKHAADTAVDYPEYKLTGEMIKEAHRSFVLKQTQAARERTKHCACSKCGTEWHRPNALYCCQCGTKLVQSELRSAQ